MDQILVHCVLEPDTGMFNFSMTFGEKSFKCKLVPEQFLSMVQYLGQVGVSYQEWLKNGGK